MKHNDVFLMDGAAGTTLWHLADAAGIPREPVWKYNIEHPELVRELHRRYIDAGSQLIQANTFGANGPVVTKSSPYTVEQVVSAGVRLAKEAVQGTDVIVGLSFGPLSVLLEPFGDLEEDECDAIYTEMIDAGVAAGADCVILEAFMDVEMMRIAAQAAKRHNVPVLCSMTFEGGGRTMMGNTVQQIVDTLTPLSINAIGMNCSLGPAEAMTVIRQFHEATDLPLFFKPNSGKPVITPDGQEIAPYTEEHFAQEVAPALEFVRYIGGCCGCDDTYIRALKRLME